MKSKAYSICVCVLTLALTLSLGPDKSVASPTEMVSPVFYADRLRTTIHKVMQSEGVLLAGRLKRQAVHAWWPVQGRVCLYRCFDEFEMNMLRLDMDQPNTKFHTQFYDREIVTGVCNAYRAVQHCMQRCRASYPRLPPSGQFLMGPLNFMCIDYYDVLERSLPCYDRTNETVAQTCGGNCPGEEAVNEVIVISDPRTITKGRFKQLLSGMCSFISCLIQCQTPIFERECASTQPGSFASDFFHFFFVQTVEVFSDHIDLGKDIPRECASLDTPKLAPDDRLNHTLNLKKPDFNINKRHQTSDFIKNEQSYGAPSTSPERTTPKGIVPITVQPVRAAPEIGNTPKVIDPGYGATIEPFTAPSAPYGPSSSSIERNVSARIEVKDQSATWSSATFAANLPARNPYGNEETTTFRSTAAPSASVGYGNQFTTKEKITSTQKSEAPVNIDVYGAGTTVTKTTTITTNAPTTTTTTAATTTTTTPKPTTTTTQSTTQITTLPPIKTTKTPSSSQYAGSGGANSYGGQAVRTGNEVNPNAAIGPTKQTAAEQSTQWTSTTVSPTTTPKSPLFKPVPQCTCYDEVHELHEQIYGLKRADKLLKIEIDKVRLDIESLTLMLKATIPEMLHEYGKRKRS